MFVQLVHIRIKPGRVKEFHDVFRINFEGTRAEPGNFRFDVLQDPEDENHFVIYEAFENEAAVEAHRQTEHYRVTVDGLKDLMTTDNREKDFFQMVMPDHDAALAGSEAMEGVGRSALEARCHGVAAGLMAAGLGGLDRAVRDIGDWGGTIAHFDVMDGVFVPQITLGAAFVAALGDSLLRDVHLMVAHPEHHVAAFANAGADIITVHAEAEGAADALDIVRAQARLLERPILAGLAVMPTTPLEQIEPLLTPVPDLILSLAIDPRSETPADLALAGARLRRLAQMTAPARPLLAIDGGVTCDSVALATAQQPDMIVSGSAIFRAPDPCAAFRHLAESWRASRPQESGVSA